MQGMGVGSKYILTFLSYSIQVKHWTMTDHTYDISQEVRIAILDGIELRHMTWCGGQNHADLLMRLLDLNKLPSTDSRYSDAYGDIWQHTVNNDDWDTDWVYTDNRIQLLSRTDQFFLKFLTLVLSPKVRRDAKAQSILLEDFNKALLSCGFQFVPTSNVGPLNNYSAVRDSGLGSALKLARSLSEKLEAPYFNKEVERLSRSINTGDEAQLIGDAKDLLETVALTIIQQRGGQEPSSTDLQARVKAALVLLELTPEKIEKGHIAEKALKRIFSSIPNLVQGLAELRNTYGKGHGRTGNHSSLERRHAVLAVQSSLTVATFLIETHYYKSQKNK